MAKYENAQIKQNQRDIKLVCRMIRKSEKPKQLTAFLIRAKALYKHTSVMDKPFENGVDQELEYVSWLAEQLAAIILKSEEMRRDDEEGKKKAVKKLVFDRKSRATTADTDGGADDVGNDYQEDDDRGAGGEQEENNNKLAFYTAPLVEEIAAEYRFNEGNF